jgi:hypothetical protein
MPALFSCLFMPDFPISFWVAAGVLIAGAIWSIQRIKDGTGIPMLAVIGTVTAWYVGDVFYNDYGIFLKTFNDGVLQNAWWEVAWFLVVFLVAVPYVHRWFNARYLRQQSGVYQLARFGVNQPALQRQLDILFIGCASIYAILVLVAAIRIKGEMFYFFFPYLGYKPEPWGRGRIGTGFDAALSFAEYIQMMVSAIFGVMAAVSTNRRTRYLALLLCFIAWPYYLFDRTRNSILAAILPAILTWVFLRLRGSLLKKVVILGVCYLALSAWMAFIIENRSNGSIANAFKERGFNFKRESSVHHEGLNMYEELCWINTFIEKGTYNPNWGARYFAELVNPIPRALWHGKPLIGIDYAIARGQGVRSANDANSGNGGAGVNATMSTGMIGQGVVNFGTILGPAAAALLMSFWVAVLARQDLNISKLGRLPLYALGLILTFNLGRDITLITLYPFVFGTVLLWWLDRHPPRLASSPASNPSAGSPAAGPTAGRPIQKRPRRVGMGLRPHRRPGGIRRS